MRRVTAVDKVNVLGEMYEIWRESIRKVAQDYPEIELEFTLIDAITMFFVRRPEHYQVVIAPNLFGDIITDLAAGLVGGMGMAPGGNINPEGGPSMFEPIHGSGPDIAGKGIANPMAAILAGAMMLEHLGEERAARLLEQVQSGALDIAVVYDAQRRQGVINDLLIDDKLVFVRKAGEQGKVAPEAHVRVDWGEAFAAAHEAAFPELAHAGIAISHGPLALDYILAVGGSGYFRLSVARPLLASGALALVPHSPVFSYSVYMVHSSKADEDTLARIRAGLRAAATVR